MDTIIAQTAVKSNDHVLDQYVTDPVQNELRISSNRIWHQDGEVFRPGNTTTNSKLLPPAIYRYVLTPTGDWYLEKISSRYTFPYKIYGTHDKIINRIIRAWDNLPSNFGILLNGLKGTGKTITAQQIVNWAIDRGFAVLNVSSPVPLTDIMDVIQQPLLVLFDEFEKTHDEKMFPGCQQQLLSAIDGLSKNEFRKLFLFTTNTKNVNENFIDRPSRIRYCWEFNRLDNDVIEMIMDDTLDPTLKHMRASILSYLSMREVLTIDVVKTIIAECNIFREDPEEFRDFLNLTEKKASSYLIEGINENGEAFEVSLHYKPTETDVQKYFTKSGRKNFIERICAQNQTFTIYNQWHQAIELIGPAENNNEWIAYVQVSSSKTWVSAKLERDLGLNNLWLDERPKDWRPPPWAAKLAADISLSEQEDNEYNLWLNAESVFGGPKTKIKIRFTVNKEYKHSYSAF